MRESPNVDLARMLLRAGYDLSIFDPTVDVAKLAGANLGYAWPHLPQLSKLLVSKEEVESRHFDRIIAANRTVRELTLPQGQNIIDINALA